MTIPLAIAIPVGSSAMDIGTKLMNRDYKGLNQYAGLDANGNVHMESFIGAYGPWIAGFAIHWGATRFGVNRALGRARIPVIRV
jgi:hypothetical protein